MTKYWKLPAFQALQAEWYVRLKENGFQDAERLVGTEPSLSQFSKSKGKASEEKKKQSETYFNLLWYRVQAGEAYACQEDEIIMTMTAEGAKIKEISDHLKSLGLRKHYRNSIRFVRRRYEHLWGIRYWPTESMVSRKPRTRS